MEVGVEVEVAWYGSVKYSIQSKCVVESGTRYTYLLLRTLLYLTTKLLPTCNSAALAGSSPLPEYYCISLSSWVHTLLQIVLHHSPTIVVYVQ